MNHKQRGVIMNSKFANIPIPSGNEVYWEPWVDAYDNEEVERTKQLFEDEFNKQMEMIEGEFEEDSENSPEFGDEISMFEKPIKTIITPFGVLPLTEHSLASNYFKFWIGHTNFKVLKTHASVIESCDGVESLDILTPYRFRIAAGKLFRDRDVMYNVRKALLKVVAND